MNENQRHILLKVARDTVEAVVKDQPFTTVESDDDQLNAHCGCFVTLKNNEQLRGCIGQFTADKPLIELIAEMAKNIIKLFDEEPDIDILSLAPQDGGGFCECDRCRALDEERPPKEAWHARYSNRLAVFNNAVAKRVAVKYPDKLIKVGAYAMYLRVPQDPDYRPAPNLAIQVCHTYALLIHPSHPHLFFSHPHVFIPLILHMRYT